MPARLLRVSPCHCRENRGRLVWHWGSLSLPCAVGVCVRACLCSRRQLLNPAVGGTLNVLESCAKSASIKRVVLTSSIAAVAYKEVEANHVFTDQDWSDEDLLRRQEMWYMLRCAAVAAAVPAGVVAGDGVAAARTWI